MPDQEEPRPDLLKRTKDFLSGFAGKLVREPVEQIANAISAKIAKLMIGLAFVCTAVVFLLVGLVSLLQEVLHGSRYAVPVAFLGLGAVAGLFGLLVLMQKKT